jgi:HSP20 family protein
MDVFEKDGKLHVRAELPGVKKEDIQVLYDRGELQIKGERKSESEVKEEDYYRCERSYGSFFRRLPLSFEVEPDAIEANYKDGILEIGIPKPAEAAQKGRQIAVK